MSGLVAAVHHDDPGVVQATDVPRLYRPGAARTRWLITRASRRGYMYGHGMVAGLAASLYYAEARRRPAPRPASRRDAGRGLRDDPPCEVRSRSAGHGRTRMHGDVHDPRPDGEGRAPTSIAGATVPTTPGTASNRASRTCSSSNMPPHTRGGCRTRAGPTRSSIPARHDRRAGIRAADPGCRQQRPN